LQENAVVAIYKFTEENLTISAGFYLVRQRLKSQSHEGR